MAQEESQDITSLLAAWSKGDEEAFHRVISVVYPELWRIARQQLIRWPLHHTLESAALANEAYLKLLRAQGFQCENRVHFFALCARVFRGILADDARRHSYAKRGGTPCVSPWTRPYSAPRPAGSKCWRWIKRWRP